MSLSQNEFNVLIVRRGQETNHAIADHKAREEERARIAKQVEDFLKRGGKMEVLPPAGHSTAPTYISSMSSAELNFLEVTVSNLRSSFGKQISIRQDPQSGMFKAFYHGEQLGEMHKTVTAAEKAIKNRGIKDRQKAKAAVMKGRNLELLADHYGDNKK